MIGSARPEPKGVGWQIQPNSPPRVMVIRCNGGEALLESAKWPSPDCREKPLGS